MKNNGRYIIYLILSIWLQGCQLPAVKDAIRITREPNIFPDYTGVTVPVNIAPLNFKLQDSCDAIMVTAQGSNSELTTFSKGNKAQFDIEKWHNLLQKNRGDSLLITVFAQRNSQWLHYNPFKIIISEAPVDNVLVYRLILPGYQSWNEMGIYQRSLTNFSQDPVLTSKLMPGTCMNCHSFAQHDPNNMVLHLRENHGATLLIRDGKIERLQTKTKEMFSAAAFPSWHPSKKYIAFSIDKVRQIFHAIGHNRAHALDLNSDLVVYDVAKNSMITSSLIFAKDAYETFPDFSPDGQKLYYCSSKSGDLPADYKKMKYSLCAIPFDAQTGTFGSHVDTLISSSETGKSYSIPKVSPDGRFIMFNRFNYGNFPSYNQESDLCLYDVTKKTWKPLPKLNSTEVESYHTWSSNGRWVVFSTRRIDGLYSTPFIAYMDNEGNPGKPFLLPQEDPDFYQDILFSFNLPEFVKSRLNINAYQLDDAARNLPITQVKFGGIQQPQMVSK